jgi:uncharacterized tellurite resistance protein B-like protein
VTAFAFSAAALSDILSLMTESEINIFKSLVAVAWADGTLDEPEQDMIDSLLWAFAATDEEENELREFAKEKRTLQNVPLGELDHDDRELLLAHAALLTHADGAQTGPEKKVLGALVKELRFSKDQAKAVISEARKRAAKLAERS